MGSLGTVLTAAITPLDDELEVDEEAFVALLHHLHQHGSDGVVVAGSTGEAATLTDDEHIGLVELAVPSARAARPSSPAPAPTTRATRSS